mmetsp:Transcript_79319/g.201925  ORF Transcript_79319/g.201925 Transcript_79319/m.201925 type:complete len:447 (-) Transcript_79319:50-1390(-)
MRPHPTPAAKSVGGSARSLVIRVRALSGAIVWGPEALDASTSSAELRRRVATALGHPEGKVRLVLQLSTDCLASGDVGELPATNVSLAEAIGNLAASSLDIVELAVVLLTEMPDSQACARALPGVYIAESTNHRVTRWPLGAPGRGEVVAGGNGRGQKSTQLAGPRGVFVDASGRLLVAETGNDRVTCWAPGATSSMVVAGGEGRGDRPWQLSEPHGICVDNAGAVLVAEAGNHRVTRWPQGAEIGEVVAGGRGPGSELGQLDTPMGIFIDQRGALLVAEAGNSRVTLWLPGATQGEVVAGGRGAGDELWQLGEPRGVCSDEHGTVFVSEAQNDRVTRWAPGAQEGVVHAGGMGQGDEAWQLNEPIDICLDDAGVLYVAEAGKLRITRWTPGAERGEVVAGGHGRGTELGVGRSQLGSPCGVFIFSEVAAATAANLVAVAAARPAG